VARIAIAHADETAALVVVADGIADRTQTQMGERAMSAWETKGKAWPWWEKALAVILGIVFLAELWFFFLRDIPWTDFVRWGA
jgi:2-polyprenyl-6-methoxyphenol hydroxylase-like FAD-dependent oxidoreductase